MDNIKILYLDQFATSGIFESSEKEWLHIKELIEAGVRNNKIICPRSVEHLLETSQKNETLAEVLDKKFDAISCGYSFKPEAAITSQLTISLIRRNNITLNTYLYKDRYENTSLKNEMYSFLNNNKKILNKNIEDACIVANKLRSISRTKNNKQTHRTQILETLQKITVFEMIDRLNDYLNDREIIRRNIPFESGDVPHWIDQLIYQLIHKHRITIKETKALIRELKNNGFSRIPTLDIRYSIKSLIAFENKKETVNDEVDIMRITTGLPLSDILLTDKQRKNEIIELELDKKYNTKVFSGTKNDLRQIISELEK